MGDKVNYQIIFKNRLDLLDKTKKPTLLLHVCCGPCFTIPFEELKDHFKVSIMYNNSNIYPEEEYTRRLNELKRYVSEVCPEVDIIEVPYDNKTYNIDLEPFADQPEGHVRCRLCFRKRLSFGYDYAEAHGFDYYGTVMTISRYKNAQDLNIIGADLERQHPHTKWLYADFKKDNGYERSIQIVKAHNMYFQHYCGCIYSYQKFLEKKTQK